MDQQTRLSVLRVDASARTEGSVTRALGDTLITALAREHGPLQVTVRDLAREPLPQVHSDWVAANFTDPDQRTPEHRALLSQSDRMVGELQQARILVIGAPMYNFAIPAALKAWVDLVARARVTFRYTEHGPEGLLRDKRAYLLTATGGAAVNGEADFVIPYMRHVLGFLGITDVEVIAADQLALHGDARLEQAHDRIAALLPGADPRSRRPGAVAAA